jgi:hypothetical protein
MRFPAPHIEKCGCLRQRLMAIHSVNKRETTLNGKRPPIRMAAVAYLNDRSADV